MHFPISLASYSFHGLLGEGRFDVFTYLEACRSRYGVDFADIWTGFLPGPDENFARKVKKSLDERSLGLANLCVDGPCVWVDDPDGRAANKEMMLKYIKAADIMGAKTIRIDFGGSEAVPMTDEAFEWIVSTYREYCSVCGDLGMRIGPENHWGWDRMPQYLVKVRDAVDSPVYGHLFHFGNFSGDYETGTEEVIKYAMHTHVPANMIPQAKEIIRRLAKSGYAGTYSVEHHSGSHELERAGWQLGAVRTFIDELKEEGVDAPASESYIINGK